MHANISSGNRLAHGNQSLGSVNREIAYPMHIKQHILQLNVLRTLNGALPLDPPLISVKFRNNKKVKQKELVTLVAVDAAVFKPPINHLRVSQLQHTQKVLASEVKASLAPF